MRNGAAGNFYTAQPTTMRDQSPVMNPAVGGTVSKIGQYFPPQGQWFKANEVRIIYNRTPDILGQ